MPSSCGGTPKANATSRADENLASMMPMSVGLSPICCQSRPPSKSIGRPAFDEPEYCSSIWALRRLKFSSLKVPLSLTVSAPEGRAEFWSKACIQLMASLFWSMAYEPASMGLMPYQSLTGLNNFKCRTSQDIVRGSISHLTLFWPRVYSYADGMPLDDGMIFMRSGRSW